jgi:hypothetical protein
MERGANRAFVVALKRRFEEGIMRTAIPYPQEMQHWLEAQVATNHQSRLRWYRTQDVKALAEAVQGHARAQLLVDRLTDASREISLVITEEMRETREILVASLEGAGHDAEDALAGNGIGAFVSLAVDLEFGVPAVIHPDDGGRLVLTWMEGPSGALGETCPVPDDFDGFWDAFRPKLLRIAEKYRNVQTVA